MESWFDLLRMDQDPAYTLQELRLNGKDFEELREIKDFTADTAPCNFVRMLGRGANGLVEVVGIERGFNGTLYKEGDPYIETRALFARKTFQSPRGGIRASEEALKTEHDIMVRLSKLPYEEQKHKVKHFHSYTVYGGRNVAQHYLVMTPIAHGGNLTQFLARSISTYLPTFTVTGS